MFARKNRHAPELSGANCYTKLKSFETVAEKYLFSDVSTLLFTDEKKQLHRKPQRIKNHQPYTTARRKTSKHKTPTINVQTVTDGISLRVTSGWENSSLILNFVHRGVKVIEGWYHNVMLL